MQNDFLLPESGELQEICRSALTALSPHFHRDRISAAFYPYLGLTHTIRRRGATWVIRISDHCVGAPGTVLESIAVLLACKVLRRKPPAGASRTYAHYRQRPDVERSVHARRLRRGRKQIREPRGRYHALDEVYSDLNRQYFHGQVDVRKLGWGPRRSWSRMGHYDPVHHTITISPVLDSPDVPVSVVSYILYHEMLHTLFNGDTACGRRRHHPPEFRRAENAFPFSAEARQFLDRFCRTRGRVSSRLPRPQRV